MVKKQDPIIDIIDVQAAMEFLYRYYPSLWEEVGERNLLRLMVISYTLFKANPELLEAKTTNRTPTQ